VLPRQIGRRPDGRAARIVRDFGDQWQSHASNDGFYGSLELLGDVVGPLVPLSELSGARVADVGSGTGRIVRMLLAAGAAHVTALEPSRGVETLRRNTAEFGQRVRVLECSGEQLPADLGVDFVTAIGVLPFVPDPSALLRAAYRALRPGGRLLVWLYAAEGSRLLHAAVGALRTFTTRLPHASLIALCGALDRGLDLYLVASRRFDLPLREYMQKVYARLTRETRRLTLYDQLNPSYVRYYSRDELELLLARCGFVEIRLHDRHGYSWSAVATRPAREPVQVASSGGGIGS
jgi:SAM-dependent methyltransferase